MSVARLGGKVALVTGGGTGIGRAIALAFAREGAKVAVLGRRPGPLAEVVARIEEAGGEALSLPADIRDPGAAAAAVAATVERYGGLDVLVNNAACYVPHAVADTDPDEWEAVLQTNLAGPFRLARAAFPALAERGGVVLNVSSTLGQRPVAGAAAYCVAKAGLDMLTRVLALEWAGSKVRANAIALGIVDTPIHEAREGVERDAWLAQAARMHPLGRIGTPSDAAEAAVFLAGKAASWVTGAILTVDGGISLA